MTLAMAKAYIEVAPPEAMPGGIMSVANVVGVTGHELLGAEYMTDACADGGVWAELCSSDYPTFCPPPGAPPAVVKLFGEPELVEGEPVIVYAGTECVGGFGRSDAEWLAQAERRLGYAEGRMLDMEIEAWLAANSIPVAPGPFDIVSNVAYMENYASMVYGGYATLLYPRAVVTVGKAEMVFFDDGDGGLTTANGSKVASLANSELVSNPTFGYVTGQITLLQGPVASIVVPEVTRLDGTCDPKRALAERVYVPLIECMVGSLQVSMP